MGLLRWLERKLVTGEVIRDYGTLGELNGVGGPGQVSLLLCKRRGRLQLVFRTHTRFELNWYPVKASAGLAARLAEVAEDVRRAVEREGGAESPACIGREQTTAIRELRGSGAGERRRGEGTANEFGTCQRPDRRPTKVVATMNE